MPKSHHSKFSDDKISSISGVSGNYGGQPFSQGMSRADTQTWANNHYPAPPGDYVSTYPSGVEYYPGTSEHRDHQKYSGISGQAKKSGRRYEDERDKPRIDPTAQYYPNTYRKDTRHNGYEVDPHERMIPYAADARDKYERSARNRDKFDQKHSDVYWTEKSKLGHHEQALGEYRSSQNFESKRQQHEDYRYGGTVDQRKIMPAMRTAAHNIHAIQSMINYP